MIEVAPIGYVMAARTQAEDDYWGATESVITLNDEYPEDALAGLEEFSHAEILYVFHRVEPAKIVSGARHPRNNTAWPKIGIFAQRGKNRPNRIGSSIVRVIAREGRTLRVAELDAIDGTPVIDIKPVMQEFQPREAVRQPSWVSELMAHYWDKA
jgi:tRNA-Thr(GGU) m(6)t(6)A37 methyltransferase TsaA